MTSDTSMLRVRNNLKEALKKEAAKQGRTLEWLANDALDKYLYPPAVEPKKPLVVQDLGTVIKSSPAADAVTYTEDWGA